MSSPKRHLNCEGHSCPPAGPSQLFHTPFISLPIAHTLMLEWLCVRSRWRMSFLIRSLTSESAIIMYPGSFHHSPHPPPVGTCSSIPAITLMFELSSRSQNSCWPSSESPTSYTRIVFTPISSRRSMSRAWMSE